MMKKKKLLLLVLLLTFLSVVCLMAVNFIVDPHGRILLVNKAGFNRDKLTIKPQSRKAKAAILRECEKDVVFLGSTRAEAGIDPDSAIFSGKRSYNAALKGSSMLEAKEIGLYMLDFQTPDQVLLDLGFYMFNEARGGAHDFYESPLAGNQSIASVFSYLLSLQTLNQSYFTLRQNRAGMSMCDLTGYGIGFPVRGRPLERMVKRVDRYAKTPGLYGEYRAGEVHYQSLEELLKRLTSADIKVQIYLSPVHALHLEGIRRLELMNDYEDWKRRLVWITEEVNEGLSDESQVTLLDFSGYNSVSMETVPLSDEGEMRWFYDSAANSPELGEIIAAFLMGAPGKEKPADFGVVLNSTNIDDYIEQQRAAGIEYSRANVDLVNRVFETYSVETAAGMAQSGVSAR